MSILRNSVLALGATAIAAGGAGAYVYFNGVPWASKASGALARADVVPSNALVSVYLSTDEASWAALNAFGTPAARSAIDQQLQDFKTQVSKDLAQEGISYENDIRPWADGVMIAVLPSGTATEVQAPATPLGANPALQNTELLAVVGVKNPLKAAGLLQKLNKDKSLQLKEQTHQGVKLMEITKAGATSYAAMVGKQLVYSNQRLPIEQAIATFKGEPSLADTASKGLSDTQALRNPVARLYIPSYSKLILGMIGDGPQAASLPDSLKAQLNQVGSINAVLGIESTGLRLKGSSQIDSTLRPATFNNPNQAIARFPADTLVFASLYNLSDTWGKTTQALEASPDGKQGLQTMRDALQSIKLDLDRDIFGWMTGELALGVLPLNQGMVGSFGMGGAMVIDSSDRAATERLLTQLNGLAKQNTLTVRPGKIGTTAITEWVVPQLGNETVLGYGWLDQDSLFIATGRPLVETLAQAPKTNLTQSPSFQTAASPLASTNLGYNYIDVRGLVNVMERGPMKASMTSAETGMEILKSIQGIGITSTWENPKQAEFDMHVALEPAQR